MLVLVSWFSIYIMKCQNCFVQSKARFDFFSDSQMLIFQPVFFQFAADAKIIKKPPQKIEKRTIGKINSKVI